MYETHDIYKIRYLEKEMMGMNNDLDIGNRIGDRIEDHLEDHLQYLSLIHI